MSVLTDYQRRDVLVSIRKAEREIRWQTEWRDELIHRAREMGIEDVEIDVAKAQAASPAPTSTSASGGARSASEREEDR